MKSNLRSHIPNLELSPLGRKKLILALTLLAVTLLAFVKIIDGGFLVDDYGNIVDHLPIQVFEPSIAHFIEAGVNGRLGIRVLPNISFAVDWWRGNGAASAFLVTNLLIHLGCTLLVFRLFVLLGNDCQKTAEASRVLPAFFAALMWAIHPIQLQAVAYIVQRMTEMAALFVVLVVIAYCKARFARSLAWYLVCALSLLAAVFTKENAWISPVLLLLAEWGLVRRARWTQSLSKAWPLWLLGVIAMLVLVDLAIGGPIYQYFAPGYLERSFTMAQRLMTQPVVIGFHLWQMVLPLPGSFSIEHDFTVANSLLDPVWVLPAWLLLLSYIALACRLIFGDGARVVGFMMLWPVVTLVIESSVVPLEMVFEHRMYLPSVGIFGLVALGLAKGFASIRKKFWTALCVGICAGYLISTLIRVHEWVDPVAFNAKAIANAPRSDRAWLNYGVALADQGLSEQALAAFDKAAALAPKKINAYINRGRLLSEQLNRHVSGIQDLQLALEADPVNRLANRYLGDIYLRAGQPERAVVSYQKIIELESRDYFAHNNLGLAHLQQGRYRQALVNFNNSIAVNARYDDAYANRAIAWIKLRRPLAALADARRAVVLNENNAYARYALGKSLSASGERADARLVFKIACERMGHKQSCLEAGF